MPGVSWRARQAWSMIAITDAEHRYQRCRAIYMAIQPGHINQRFVRQDTPHGVEHLQIVQAGRGRV